MPTLLTCLKMKIARAKAKRLTVKPDTPWLTSMSSPYDKDGAGDGSTNGPRPTIATFSPNQSTAAEQRRSKGASVIVHQKTPLLVATPPQVTRTLAYSHPFLLPLDRVAALLSWTTGDPWESFLLVASFWFVVLYGDDAIRWAGPLVMVVLIIFGMYHRRYSPLSSTKLTGEKGKQKQRDAQGSGKKTSKSLDEILECMQLFTSRCNILLEPFLQLVEYLSTQTTATAATTRPALTTLFIRILAVTPLWIALTVPPIQIITTKRVVLITGTFILSYHSRPARVSRAILWRSRTLRRLTSFLTGLSFAERPVITTSVDSISTSAKQAAAAGIRQKLKAGGSSVRFTFTIFENQRRWIGLGWTGSLLAYERQAWTDEHLNECPDPENFKLPDSENEAAKWRWVPGSEWRIHGASTDSERSAKRIGGGGGGDDSGWTYYDNKWNDARKVDGWGRYTRRRKWVREAELVDATGSDPLETPAKDAKTGNESMILTPDRGDAASVDSQNPRKRGWFNGRKRTLSDRTGVDGASISAVSTNGSVESKRSRDDPEDDHHTPVHYRQRGWEREIGDGLMEGLG